MLIPTPHVPGFHTGCQAAQHWISALGRTAALSSSTKTADGEGDGSRSMTLPSQGAGGNHSRCCPSPSKVLE